MSIEFKPITGLNETSLAKLIEMSGENYATESFVTKKINEAAIGGSGSVDLSNYATKTELNGKVDKIEGKDLSTNDYTSEDKIKVESISNIKSDIEDIKNRINSSTTDSGMSAFYNTVTMCGTTQRDLTLTTDTKNEIIHCHGLGILYHEGVYYAYGDNKVGVTTNRKMPFSGVRCYSSKDLINWKDEGFVVEPSNNPDDIGYKNNVVARPKVLYNKETNKFIMITKQDTNEYKTPYVAFFENDKPTGVFTYLGKKRPIDEDNPCWDMTVFQDDDDKAYLIVCRESNLSKMYIHEMTSDYLDFTENYCIAISTNREAPCMCKYNGKYYLITSGCTGWDPNPTEIHVADTILGTYTRLGELCVDDSNANSYGGQPTYIQAIDESKYGYPFLLYFDKWNANNLEKSGYMTLPMYFDSVNNTFRVDKNKNEVTVSLDNDIDFKISKGYMIGRTYQDCIETLVKYCKSLEARVVDLETTTGTSSGDDDTPLSIDQESISAYLYEVYTLTSNKSRAIFSCDNANVRLVYNNGVATFSIIAPVTSAVITVTNGIETKTCTISATEENTAVDSYTVYLDAANHGDNQDVWTDLSGNGNDFDLVGFTHSDYNGWKDTGLLFNGSTTYVTSTKIKPLDTERNFMIDLEVTNNGAAKNTYIFGYLDSISPYKGLKIGTSGSTVTSWAISGNIDTNNKVTPNDFTVNTGDKVNFKFLYVNKYLVIYKDGIILKSGSIGEFMTLDKQMAIGANIGADGTATKFSKIIVSKFAIKYL